MWGALHCGARTVGSEDIPCALSGVWWDDEMYDGPVTACDVVHTQDVYGEQRGEFREGELQVKGGGAHRANELLEIRRLPDRETQPG